MSTGNCPVCSINDAALRDEVERNLAGDGGIPAAIVTAAGRGVSLTKYALQKHRTERHHTAPAPAKQSAGTPQPTKPYLNTDAKVEISENGEGIIQSGEILEEQADWDTLLKNFGVDPSRVMVKDNTIRMSARTVNYVDEFGNEQKKVARSFSAAFVKKPDHFLSDAEVAELQSMLMNHKPKPVKVDLNADSTYLVCLADLQLGKSEGGGVKATLERYAQAMDGVIANLQRLIAQGYKFEQIAIAQMGDMLEGCIGNYDSQLHTVQINQRRQLELGVRVMAKTIDLMLAFGLPVYVISVNSNHGSWMRRGGKSNITSTSDTSDGAIEDQLKQVFRNDPRVGFTTLGDQAVVTAALSGVNVGFAHGHLTSQARAEGWLDDQARMLSYLEDFKPEVFVTAHSHHFKQTDLGAYQWFQCPALDGGSKWFQDARGRWSTAGILTMVVSESLINGVGEVHTAWAVNADSASE